MENKVTFFAYAENVPEDMNNLEAFVSDSIDHIVADAIVPGAKFSGFLAGKSGPAQVSLTGGRLYKNGLVYAHPEATTYDFTTQLPIAAKKIVLITAWGAEVDTGAEPRNVLIAAQSTPTNPIYQPQVLEIIHARVANLGTALGAEAPSPSAPIIDAMLLVVATVVLSPSGVDSVTMAKANQIANLTDVDGRVMSLEAWEAEAAPKLASLSADIARLSNDGKNQTDIALTGRMLGRLAVLEAKAGVPSNAADSRADFFLDPATSDLANLASSCQIAEGVRFADDGATDSALQLFNPLNPLAMIVGGVLFPAYDPYLRVSVGPKTGAIAISSYTYGTTTYVQKTMSRQRIRWGNVFTVCTNSAFWLSGTYDPVTQTFKKGVETFQVLDPQLAGQNHRFIRLKEFWTDTFAEPYWDQITTNSTISGSSVEETFPNGQDQWLESIGLQFPTLDAAGTVTLLVCECTSTGPIDPNRVLGQSTVAYASLNPSGKTIFRFATPIFLKAGSRYGFRVVTAANHYIATADGPSFPGGMFFTMIGGVAIADPTKHLVFDLYTCRFRQTIVSIDLVGLQLSGGIVGIDILAQMVAPSSTSLTFAVQSGGAWIPLDAINAGTLNAGGALPPLLPFQAVFQGTPDMMPCVNLLTSNVHVNRPKTAFTHFWPAGGRTPPSTTQIRATVRYENFDAAYHTAGAKLETGAGFATETSPSSYSDVTTADGALERTYVWNLGAAVTAFKVKNTGASSTPLKVFHIAWIKDWVL